MITSEQLKEGGMAKAAAARREILNFARQIARTIAHRRSDKCVTADDVQQELLRYGYTSEDLGNAAGSLFRGGDWEFTGVWIKSVRLGSHANDLRVWKLK